MLPTDESMLSRKFGPEVANYFAGSPLNRVSFLRSDHDFMRSAFAHPSANILLLHNLGPLVQKDTSRLAYATRADVIGLTGPDPFEKKEEQQIKDFDSEVVQPVILFLGIDDKQRLPSNGSDGPGFEYKDYKGCPYFAIDVAPRGSVIEAAKALVAAMRAKGLSFNESPRNMSLSASEAAMFGQARALLDWNARNPFCAQCGQPTLSVNAGTKRVCPPTDSAGGTLRERKPCATRNTVSNIVFPRTDPTVIMAVMSDDGARLLLGRQRRWPKDWYSTLAGFLEPGESVEEAVRREVWEESGVHVGRVVLHSSQPWPFPNSLMIGAVAQALPGDGEKIYLGNDAELEDAKWYPIAEFKTLADAPL
ncbi:hypothetical protein P8C59_000349 [Phyllachora maydis]|uniref:NAD(+) diphosphatase n=1 Tax=Phyllachora maydis TaxID=1825666 RepID=A0AAD9MA72_9PEZI|nr:hypothetical protein P8C59_000349 [Phyllachora maydis]